jgi:hypothetical protein
MGPKPSGGIFDSLTPEQAQEMINGMFGTGGVSNSGVPTPSAPATPKPTPTTTTTTTPTAPTFTNAQVKGTLDTLINQYKGDNEGLYRAVAKQIKASGVPIEGAAKQISEIFTLDGKPVTADEIAAKYKQLGFAQGGLASLPQSQGYYLGGSTDGMADQIPASINGQQKAALSDGEFVMPADVVSGLGNGNSDAGAKVLYSMMDRVRQARTGTKEQGRKITPNKFTPA